MSTDLIKTSNICDVAKLAGVSRMTVSRVINNAANVRPETILRVKKAIKSCGYRPGAVKSRQGRGAHKRRHATYRKMQVALLSGFEPFLLDTPVYGKVMHGIEEALRQRDYSMIVRKFPVEKSWNSIPPKIDGAILFQVPTDNERLLRELRRIPCVRVMGAIKNNDFFDHVSYNNSQVGQFAAEYLLKNGHRRVAIFWSGSHACQFEIERYKKFAATIEANGGEIISCEDNSFIDESNGKGQIPNVRKLVQSVEKLQKLDHVPTAIFATVDIISAGLYYVLPHLNLVPGRDIEIISCNNDEPYINPLYEENLVTIDIHPELVGKRAVEQLFWRIDNPKEAINVIEIEVEIINKNKQIKKGDEK